MYGNMCEPVCELLCEHMCRFVCGHVCGFVYGFVCGHVCGFVHMSTVALRVKSSGAGVPSGCEALYLEPELGSSGRVAHTFSC